ncbi:MAG: hypothetical protein CFE25_17165 [Chitinophagaceae bacterium BSSC1]|nr:MAG: hypothetical protein CFE25_17165 [Chitinophagaceae bacterium BSSC1]
MSININGNYKTRNYEEAGRNIFLLSEALERNKSYLTHLATDSKNQFDQLKSDYTDKHINQDTYIFYLKQIAAFVEKLNQPFTINVHTEILEELKKQTV